MKIHLRKAGNGDSIQIDTNQANILVDGGTAKSFNSWYANEKLDSYDLIVVTHIDDDHTNGILKLLSDNKTPTIKQFWFNGIEQVLELPIELSESNNRINKLKLQGLSADSALHDENREIAFDEGASLSFIAKQTSTSINNVINGKTITRTSLPEYTDKDFKITIIGPTLHEISELKSIWINELDRRDIKTKIIDKQYTTSFEKYLSSVKEKIESKDINSDKKKNTVENYALRKNGKDDSLNNRSSISFVIESNNKKILMLGDCHMSTLYSWMDDHNLEELEVDAVKLSHHGSKKNIDDLFFKKVKTKKYLISTNGFRHRHPDLETICKIAHFKKTESNIKIFTNYDYSHLDAEILHEIEKEYINIDILFNYNHPIEV
ncbi:MBL fold metallo-hydrolase [Vibrio cyclitrophicus]